MAKQTRHKNKKSVKKVGRSAEPAATEKRPRTGANDPDKCDHETIVWRFSSADLDGCWGWRSAAGKEWWKEIFPKLCHLETMTWAEINAASGGKKAGNNNHPVQVHKLSDEAKKRLYELGQDDLEELFSLRLTGTKRIYGIRDRRALKLLWYDKYHADKNKAVYPLKG